MSEVTRDDIVGGVRSLGVSAGDLLLVHSSLSSFGRVAGGAETAARALADAVSPGGTVFVPTFNYGQLPYDPRTTPSLAGAITEAFWRLPGARRSLHPTHAVAGIGPRAEEVLAGHERTTPFGPGSPLWRLWEHNAWVMLIGCDHTANSMIHVAEEVERLPYLDRTRAAKVLRDGTWVTESVRQPGCSAGFNKIDGTLQPVGTVRNGTIGAARVLLMRAGELVHSARAALQHDPAALLCGGLTCGRCSEARAMLQADGR